VRQRWLGATGIKVPEIAVEGELELPDGTLVVDGVADLMALRAAFDDGRGVAVRADTPGAVRTALTRPEVSCVLVPPDRRDLLELDLTALTYG
jgi:hypothetical protein